MTNKEMLKKLHKYPFGCAGKRKKAKRKKEQKEHNQIRALIKSNISYDNLVKLFNEGKITFNVFETVAKTCTVRLEFDKGDFNRDSL